MTSATDLTALVAAAKGGVFTLDPPGKEFQGPLVIRKPVTIDGQGGTIWAERGPAVIVESAGVVLTEMNIEVTGPEGQLTGEETCALVARGAPPTLARVAIRGHVAGVPGEEGEWRYPRIVRLNKVQAGTSHSFAMRLAVPVACKIESLVSGVTVAPADLRPGATDVAIQLESMAEGVRLRGLIRLSTGRLTRRIELSGHIAAAGAGVATGTGQVVYQPSDWAGGAAVPAPAPPPVATVPPPPPVAVAPPPAPRPTPVPAPAAQPAPAAPVAVAPIPPLPPEPVYSPPPAPVPPVAAPEVKPKSRYRSVGTPSGGLFGAPPPEAEAPAAPAPDPVPPAAPPAAAAPEPEPPAAPKSDPLKPGRRKINRLPGLFGEPPPAE
jgi:hypothetical protein